MKRLLLILAACCIVLPVALAAEVDLTPVQRARVVMDLIKDGDVTTPANYAGVDLLGAAESIKYANAFCVYFGGPVDGTNDEKARFYINQLRSYHRQIYLHTVVTPAAATAASTAEATVTTDLGTEETAP